MNRFVMFMAFVVLIIMIAVPVAAATVIPVFGFLGLDSLTDALLGIASIVITAVVPILGRRFVGTQKRQAQADEFDRIADGIVGAIRLNNPDNRVVDIVDKMQNQVFNELKANPTVTNSPSVLTRIASAAIVRALDGESGRK